MRADTVDDLEADVVFVCDLQAGADTVDDIGTDVGFVDD